MKTVLFDIDGTLADLGHREHHVTGGRRNWDAFFAEAGDDGCYEPIRNLARALADSYRIVLVSGRTDAIRSVTLDWLARHGVPFCDLRMRRDGDYRSDVIVKSEILDALLADGEEIEFVVDDRPSVVAMWRERGLTCLQCRDWDEVRRPSRPALLTVMVGPSGAGKTSWLHSDAARELGIHPSHVISSDQLRADLCGDFRDQSRNEHVFAALHAVARERLRHGLPTAIDATNLRRKDRLACVELNAGGPVRYVVLDRPMAEKRRDAGWRAEVNSGPVDLIAKHDQTFRSQLADILAGDHLPNVTVTDLRSI